MGLRDIESVGGAIHDVARLKSMDDGPCNVVLVSERTLNIIQNYAIDEATYTSRYGVEFKGGDYVPVDPEHTDYEFVLGVIRAYRNEVNDMTCDLVAAIAGLTATISASATADCACQIGSDVETTDGEEGGDLPDPVNGQEYTEPSPISDRKCKAANYIHQGIRDIVNELKLNRADQYSFAGLQFVLTLVTTVIGGLVAGPFGVLVGAVVGSGLSMALSLFKGSFSLTILLAAITADEQAAVCALYEATSASIARADYLQVLDDEGATSVELEFIGHLLSNNILNLLFFEWGDSEDAIDNVVAEQTCTACAPPAGCPWVFAEIYTGSGDLTKDGEERTLTATVGPGGFYRLHVNLDTVSGSPGEDCDSEETINAKYTIVSHVPASPTFTTYHPWKWVGEVRTNPGNWSLPPDEVEREASELVLTSEDPFTMDIILSPGNFQG